MTRPDFDPPPLPPLSLHSLLSDTPSTRRFYICRSWPCNRQFQHTEECRLQLWSVVLCFERAVFGQLQLGRGYISTIGIGCQGKEDTKFSLKKTNEKSIGYHWLGCDGTVEHSCLSFVLLHNQTRRKRNGTFVPVGCHAASICHVWSLFPSRTNVVSVLRSQVGHWS